MAKLFVKLAAFAALTLAAGRVLLRQASSVPNGLPYTGTPLLGNHHHAHTVMALVLGAAALVLFPKLDSYPWAAPDEVHHLAVARNLAHYGVYASGNPNAGFRHFDNYDSVGAPVIAPVALALRVAGHTFGAGRFVMSVYFLALCGLAYLLLSPLFGGYSAVAGVSVMTLGFGSLYLGRTLYGEVPALTFLIGGLLLWRRALRIPALSVWGAWAGIMFGLAVLCKSIIALSAFAFLGALVYDLMTYRRIRWTHIVPVALGAASAIGAWWCVQALSRHDVSGAAADTMGLYKHNLMFGLRSAPHAVGWMLKEPAALAGLVCAGVFATPILFRRRYDPPSVVLFLVGVFYVYWWVFFTPGRIPRYVWYSYAIFGMYAGAMAAAFMQTMLYCGSNPFKRALALAVIALVLAPLPSRAVDSVRAIWTCDETHSDYAAARYVEGLPSDAAIGTTYWPLAGAVDFLARRRIEILDAVPEDIESGRVVIVDEQTQPELLEGRTPQLTMGRYAVLAGTDREGP